MKKSWIFISLAIILISLPFISAQFFGGYYGQGPLAGLEQFLEGVKEFIDIVSEFLFAISAYDEFLFVKFLIGIIIFVVVLTALQSMDIFKNKERKGIAGLISLCITVLSIRYIPDVEFLNAVLLPYSAMGLAIVVILPFIVFFFFVEKGIASSAGRRLAWIFFAAIFFGMWWERYQDIGSFNWIYWCGIIAVIVAIIFDREIHKYFGIQEINAMKRKHYEDQYAYYTGKIAQIKEQNKEWNKDPILSRTVDRWDAQARNAARKI